MSNLTEISIRQSQIIDRVSSYENRFIQSWSKLSRTLSLWINRYQQRKQLIQLEPHTLKDLGLTQNQVIEEATRPFWK